MYDRIRFWLAAIVLATLSVLAFLAGAGAEANERFMRVFPAGKTAQSVSLNSGEIEIDYEWRRGQADSTEISLSWEAADLNSYLQWAQLDWMVVSDDGSILSQGQRLFFEQAHLTETNQIFTRITSRPPREPGRVRVNLMVSTALCVDAVIVCHEYFYRDQGTPRYGVENGNATLVLNFIEASDPEQLPEFEQRVPDPEPSAGDVLMEAFEASETVMVSFMKRQQSVKFDTLDLLADMASSQSGSFNAARQSDEGASDVASFQPYVDFSDAGGIAEGEARLGFASDDGRSYTHVQTEIVYKKLDNGDMSFASMVVAQHDTVISEHASVGLAAGLTSTRSDISGPMTGELTTDSLSVSPHIDYQIPELADFHGYLLLAKTDNRLELNSDEMVAVSEYETDQYAMGLQGRREFVVHGTDVTAIGGLSYAEYVGTDTLWELRSDYATVLAPSTLESAKKASAQLGAESSYDLTPGSSLSLKPMLVCSQVKAGEADSDHCGYDVSAGFNHKVGDAGAIRISVGQKDNHDARIKRATLDFTVQF